MTHQFLTDPILIKAWLKEYKVNNAKIVKDEKYGYAVNVRNSVFLHTKKLTYLPVKFNKVLGHFLIARNALTSLEGAPEEVRGTFDCSGNQLTNLEFAPKIVLGHFEAEDNNIQNLEFIPQKVLSHVRLSNNLALGNLQNIKNYEGLLAAHQEYQRVLNEKELLDHHIGKSNAHFSNSTDMGNTIAARSKTIKI